MGSSSLQKQVESGFKDVYMPEAKVAWTRRILNAAQGVAPCVKGKCVFILKTVIHLSDLNKMMELFPTESFFMREGS
jgi:hypothetical protein